MALLGHQQQLTEQLRLKCTCHSVLAGDCHLRSFGMFIANTQNEIQFADHDAIEVLRGPAEEWDAGRMIRLRDAACSGALSKYWTVVEFMSVGEDAPTEDNNHHYVVVERREDSAVRWVQACVHALDSNLFVWHIRDISGSVRCLELSKPGTAGEYTVSLEADGYPHSILLTQSPDAPPSADPEVRDALVELLEESLASESFSVLHLTGFGAIDTVFPRRMLGWSEGELLERSFVGLLAPQDRAFFCRALKKCYNDGIPQRLNIKLLAGAQAIYLDCDVTVLMPDAAQQLVLVVRMNDQQQNQPTLSRPAMRVLRWMQVDCAHPFSSLSASPSPGLSASSSITSTPETSPTLTATIAMPPHMPSPFNHQQPPLPLPRPPLAAHYEHRAITSIEQPYVAPLAHPTGQSSASAVIQGAGGHAIARSNRSNTSSRAASVLDGGEYQNGLPVVPDYPLMSLAPVSDNVVNPHIPLSPIASYMRVDDESDSDTTAGNVRSVLSTSFQQTPSLQQQGDFRMLEGTNISIAMSDIFACPPSLDSSLPQAQAGVGRATSMSPTSTLASSRSTSNSSSNVQKQMQSQRQQQPQQPQRQNGPSVVDDVFAPLLEKINLGSIRPLHFNEGESDMVDTQSNTENTSSWLAGSAAQSSKPGSSFSGHADSMVMRNQRPKYSALSQTTKTTKT